MTTVTIYQRQGDAGFQSYGKDYEARIGKKQALKIGKGYLPKMGYRVQLCSGGDKSQCSSLWLDNISGQFFVRSVIPMKDWPSAYGYAVHKVK